VAISIKIIPPDQMMIIIPNIFVCVRSERVRSWGRIAKFRHKVVKQVPAKRGSVLHHPGNLIYSDWSGRFPTEIDLVSRNR
jgi:hypothetical protein